MNMQPLHQPWEDDYSQGVLTHTHGCKSHPVVYGFHRIAAYPTSTPSFSRTSSYSSMDSPSPTSRGELWAAMEPIKRIERTRSGLSDTVECDVLYPRDSQGVSGAWSQSQDGLLHTDCVEPNLLEHGITDIHSSHMVVQGRTSSAVAIPARKPWVRQSATSNEH